VVRSKNSAAERELLVQKTVRSVGVLYTNNRTKVPAGTSGRLRGKGKNAHDVEYVVVRFPQGAVKCAPTRIEEV
jgi:hypothetical protein